MPLHCALAYSYPVNPSIATITQIYLHVPWKQISNVSFSRHLRIFTSPKFDIQPAAVAFNRNEKEEEEEEEEEEVGEDKPKFRWIEIGADVTDAQKQAISQLPPKMTKRCKAFMKQIICFSPQDSNLSLLLAAWVKIMKPKRADWLAVLKEMWKLEHPLVFEVTELALVEESFEANIRDYTKIIDAYAKQNRLHDAENAFLSMKTRGFTCDQVTLTVLVNMYSKAGHLNRAEEIFEEMKLLGLPLDKRAYGSMIMAYIRAGMTECGESLLREMEGHDIYAGKEVYKALLRYYSMAGNTAGAQRVFDSIQFARIVPDVKICALLMNAYSVAGQSEEARSVLENLIAAGLEPSDKCIAIMLSAYEKEKNLNKALALLMGLQKDGFTVGEEASKVLVGWFHRLGVVDAVELLLKQYSRKPKKCRKVPFV